MPSHFKPEPRAATAARADKVLARRRDRGRCRWPRADHDTPGHVCIGELQVAHQVAVGMGGDPLGVRTSTRELLTVCAWIHLQGKRSLEQHGRLWRGLTAAGADGLVAFYRVIGRDQFKNPTLELVGVECAIGVLDIGRTLSDYLPNRCGPPGGSPDGPVQ